MKKLIAMIGAVAMSFGLFAATPFSISFEQAESEKGVDAEAMTFTPGEGWNDWAGGALAIKGYEDGEVLPYGDAPNDRRTDSFDDKSNNDNYLPLETGKNTLTRDVGEGNIYLDQLVKFTGFEEMQTEFADGTKIAVWKAAIADDDDVVTNANLYVTVGKVDIMGDVENVALKLDGTYADDTWYRLTIKSLGDIFEGKSGTTPRAGFVIYIDGQQVACSEDVAKGLIEDVSSMSATAKSYMLAGKLFTSMTADATFAKVGYMGIGAIDDVILDAEGPLFAQVVDFDVTVPANFAVSVVSNLTKGVAITADPTSGKYSAGNGEQIGITVVANGPVVMDPTEITKAAAAGTLEVTAADLEGKYEEADVSLTRDTETTYFTQDGFEEELLKKGAVVDGDVIAVLNPDGISKEDEELGMLYSFTPGTTIEIEDVKDATDAVIACKWNVTVPDYETARGLAAGELIFNLGIEPEKQIEVTFDGANAEDGTFTFSGTIAGQGAYLKVYNGTAELSKVTLVGDAKVYVKDELTVEDVFTNADEIKGEEKDDFWVYSVQQETGFAIILADGTTTNYFPTLDAAIAAAGTGDYPAVITIMDNVTLTDHQGNVQKDLTVDLNGKTIKTTAGCRNAATAFNVDGAYTVTIKNGSIDASEVDETQTVDGEVDVLLARNGATLNLENVNVTMNSKNGACAYAFANSHININGGAYNNKTLDDYEFKPGVKGMPLNQANVADQLITVSDGSFRQYNPALGDDAGLCKTFLAEGKKTVERALEGESWWVVEDCDYVASVKVDNLMPVSFETVAEALAAVQAAEAQGKYPIVVTALATDGLTIENEDRKAWIPVNATITINKGSWTVANLATAKMKYSGAIDGALETMGGGIEKFDAQIKLNKGATVTVPADYQVLDPESIFTVDTGYIVWEAGWPLPELQDQYTKYIYSAEADQYDIVYKEGDKTLSLQPASYTIEAAVTLPADLALVGGEFEGWYDNPGFTGSPVTEIPAGQTGDKTFYAKVKAVVQGIVPGQTIGLGNPGSMTEAEAQEAASKYPVVLSDADKAAGLTTDVLYTKAELIGGAYQAVVEVKPEYAPEIETKAEEPITVGATEFTATIENAQPGLYYGFKAVDALGTSANFEPVGEFVRAPVDGKGELKLTAPKGTGNARFFKLTVSVTDLTPKAE